MAGPACGRRRGSTPSEEASGGGQPRAAAPHSKTERRRRACFAAQTCLWVMGHHRRALLRCMAGLIQSGVGGGGGGGGGYHAAHSPAPPTRRTRPPPLTIGLGTVARDHVGALVAKRRPRGRLLLLLAVLAATVGCAGCTTGLPLAALVRRGGGRGGAAQTTAIGHAGFTMRAGAWVVVLYEGRRERQQVGQPLLRGRRRYRLRRQQVLTTAHLQYAVVQLDGAAVQSRHSGQHFCDVRVAVGAAGQQGCSDPLLYMPGFLRRSSPPRTGL